MATTTQNRSEQQVNNGEQRARQDEAREQVQRSLETSEQAVSQFVEAWSNAFRSFIPAVYLRPGEALDFTYDLWQQAFSVQRRLVQELVAAARSNMQYAQERSDVDVDDRQGRRAA